MLLANKNDIPAISIETINNGRINLSNGMPADLMATSSNDSPKLPNVIMEESNKANGSASGTQVIVTSPVSLANVKKSRPLPTKSSMYNQKNCITSTKSATRNVAKNGLIKAFIIKESSFLITLHAVC